MALAVGDSDRRQVTYDTEHVSCETYIYFSLLFVICLFGLGPTICTLQEIQCCLNEDFFFILLDPEKYLSRWLSSKNFPYLVSWCPDFLPSSIMGPPPMVEVVPFCPSAIGQKSVCTH